MVDAESDLTWIRTFLGTMLTRNVSARSRIYQLAITMRKHNHAHLESAEPETLMYAEDDLLHEAEEVSPDATVVVDGGKDPSIDL